ncbi:hypothetical protein MHW47_05105 [Streptomyces sp. OfavH-34-F]|uniref:hypothetical protein n=1 Tax=Streptomyces sp. OfavH-34-F TaxID=2917760 RepID=UPI001EF21F94|nr:hypothetical protein [Streptomyces sp. OfavH-34-F]MCG7523826.1 hypothetical protein [Streptomyces sp. OfavH-34-F]
MIERVIQNPVGGFLVCPDFTIPVSHSGQTSLVNIFRFTLRWSSVLLSSLAVGTALSGEAPSYAALAVLGPLVWADRTSFTWVRSRRS